MIGEREAQSSIRCKLNPAMQLTNDSLSIAGRFLSIKKFDFFPPAFTVLCEMPNFISLLSLRAWVYGLLSGFIGGGASAVTAWAGMAGAKGLGIDVHVLNFKEAGIVMLSSGFVTAMSYLAKSPLPPVSPGNTEYFRNPNSPQPPATAQKQ